MNIPWISHKSLKQREKEIGTVIQAYADKSVDDALKKEQELTKKELNITGSVGVEVSSDAAWQKRGPQKSYNSLSGIALAIGKRTKKLCTIMQDSRDAIFAGMQQSTKDPKKTSVSAKLAGISKSNGTWYVCWNG